MCRKVILIGGFVEIIELCEENGIEIAGIVDNYKNESYLSYKVIGDDLNVDLWKDQHINTELVITPDSPKIRMRLSGFYLEHGFRFSKILSSMAHISKSSIIERGVIIQAGANISSQTVIGEFVKINNNANVMHNAEIGSFTTLAPNAVVLGCVKIGKGCYIGANATILPHVSICDDVIVGAGAVVTKSISKPGTTYVGVPAHCIK